MFGEYLLKSGAITPDQLKEALYVQIHNSHLFGELAIKINLMTGEQVVRVVRALKEHNSATTPRKRFGEIAIKLDFLSADDIEKILELQKVSRKRIGEILTELNFLTPEECERHLVEFEKAKKALGANPPPP